MPNWLIPALIWGGFGVAIVFAAALIWVEQFAPTPAEGPEMAESAAPVPLYWALLIVGLVAAAAGYFLKTRKGKSPPPEA